MFPARDGNRLVLAARGGAKLQEEDREGRGVRLLAPQGAGKVHRGYMEIWEEASTAHTGPCQLPHYLLLMDSLEYHFIADCYKNHVTLVSA